MLERIKHLPINWINGMKISKDHLLGLENALTDQIRDNQAQLLRLDNYGLLSPQPGRSQSLDFIADTRLIGDVKIVLNVCRAVTRAGARIEIVQDSEEQVNNSIKLSLAHDFSNSPSKDFYILLGVNPFSRTPVGSPNPSETPPRHPFSRPNYYLDIRAEEEINREEFGAYQLAIGKLQMRAGEIRLVDNYIPPCTCVGASPELMKAFYSHMESLFSIQKYTIEIIRKIRRKNRQSNLTENLSYISDKVVFCITEILHEFNVNAAFLPPIQLIGAYQKLARVLGTALRCIPENEREEMLNYFREWTRISSGDITHTINLTSAFEYNHYDVYGNLENIKSFLDLLLDIFHKTSEQDYREEVPRKEVYTPPPPVEEPKTTGIRVTNKKTGEEVINKYWKLDE